MELPVRLLTATATLPTRAHEGDAAFDLYADEELTIAPATRAVVGSGVALALPPGSCALVLPRAGRAARHGVTVLNAPGLIDSGYRGEIKAILHNTDPAEPFAIVRGERVAQLLVLTLAEVALVLAPGELDATSRGSGGLGSTGR